MQHDGVALAVIDELGRQDAARTHGVAVFVDRFVDHIEAVVLAQIGMKIDLGAKNFGHLRGDAVGNAGLISGAVERATDHARAHFNQGALGRAIGLAQLQRELVVALEQQVPSAVAHRQAEGNELSVAAHHRHHRAPGAQLANGLLAFIRAGQEGERLVILYAQAQEQGLQGVARLDAFVVYEGQFVVGFDGDAGCGQGFDDRAHDDPRGVAVWGNGGGRNHAHQGGANDKRQQPGARTGEELCRQFG